MSKSPGFCFILKKTKKKKPTGGNCIDLDSQVHTQTNTQVVYIYGNVPLAKTRRGSVKTTTTKTWMTEKMRKRWRRRKRTTTANTTTTTLPQRRNTRIGRLATPRHRTRFPRTAVCSSSTGRIGTHTKISKSLPAAVAIRGTVQGRANEAVGEGAKKTSAPEGGGLLEGYIKGT